MIEINDEIIFLSGWDQINTSILCVESDKVLKCLLTTLETGTQICRKLLENVSPIWNSYATRTVSGT